jgi:predicted phosphodiesterase
MLIGLVADIHDHVEPLARAVGLFRRRGVDLVVTLGDSCDAFTRHGRAVEVVELLRGAGAVGVWGNHDFGPCHQVKERTRRRYPAAALAYLATLRPRLVLGECHFSHVEQSVDPHDAAALWACAGEGTLDFAGRARRSFAAVGQRLVFVGHYHRWLAATAGGSVDWRGEGPLDLAGTGRHFVVVGAAFHGQCGLLDTGRCELTPLPC